MQTAGVDVVVPCYQYGRFLRQSVGSILSQGVDNIRVLIIDNASTDDSLEVARQLAAEDARVEVIAHPRNVGPTASYNEGVDWASAEYFILLDADDFLAPGSLARALPFMQAHPNVAFTYGIEALLYADGTMDVHPEHSEQAQWQLKTGREYIEWNCRFPRCYVGQPAVVRRTSAQKRAGYYRASLPYTDDLEMWLRLASMGDVGRLSTVQGTRRIHSLQLSEVYRKDMARDLREREAAFESFFTNEGRAVPDADRLRRVARSSLGEHAYWSAISHLVRGRTREARQLMECCLRLRPSAAVIPPVGWLLRMDRPLHRATQVAREAFGKLRAPGKGSGAVPGAR